jgi:hypothetical protein
MGPLILTALLAYAPPQEPPRAPGIAWAQAQQDEDPDVRLQGIVASLDEVRGDPTALRPRLVRAFEVWQREHDDYQGDRALAIAESMHQHAAATWSAFCLEGILRRLGHYQRADGVLVEHLGRELPPAEQTDVVLRRAIVAAGAGWRPAERAALGRGLAQGGPDAYQMLGRLALAEGARSAARALFRALLVRHLDAPGSAPPWALRGWGLALLPRQAEPLRRSPR